MDSRSLLPTPPFYELVITCNNIRIIIGYWGTSPIFRLLAALGNGVQKSKVRTSYLRTKVSIIRSFWTVALNVRILL